MTEPLSTEERERLKALSKHGTAFEINSAIIRDNRVKDVMSDPDAYDRRILLTTLRSALASLATQEADTQALRDENERLRNITAERLAFALIDVRRTDTFRDPRLPGQSMRDFADAVVAALTLKAEETPRAD